MSLTLEQRNTLCTYLNAESLGLQDQPVPYTHDEQVFVRLLVTFIAQDREGSENELAASILRQLQECEGIGADLEKLESPATQRTLKLIARALTLAGGDITQHDLMRVQ